MSIRDRFAGCLLGGAAGDALGWPVEFMRRSEILDRFGPAGIMDFVPANGGVGAVTDDTQMTLFTAEGLLAGFIRGARDDIDRYAETTSQAYARWLRTQGRGPLRGLAVEEAGWLWAQRALHDRRAPGNTCLSALAAMRVFGEPARNDSKGCGGVMRMAPAGLFAWHWRAERGLDWAFDLAARLAALTHGHPSGSLAGGALAVLIVRLVDGASLLAAIDDATACLVRRSGHEETLDALDRATRLAASGHDRQCAIEELGEGWVAEEALAISVYCALVARDFADGVVLAVNHDGDSDSTGAIAGNLLGAMHGSAAVPAHWLARLELRDVIAELATDLFDCATWPRTDAAFVIALGQKYPAQ